MWERGRGNRAEGAAAIRRGVNGGWSVRGGVLYCVSVEANRRRPNMTVKEQVRKMLEKLPDECSVEDVQHQLYVIEKVRRGLKSIDEGRGIPHDNVRKQFASCRTK
jgi:hypothetical protein